MIAVRSSSPRPFAVLIATMTPETLRRPGRWRSGRRQTIGVRAHARGQGIGATILDTSWHGP